MTTRNKYGKLPFIDIYCLKYLFLLFVILFITFPLAAIKNEKQWVVVIDAGHGGKDPGALGSFSHEKDITLAIALRTGQYIEENIPNVKVIYTREKDVFVELRDRADIANKNNADLFISVHVNWAQSKTVQGTETFIMGFSKDEQNLEVAKKENEVILLENDYTAKYEGFDPKSPESYIIFTLMQNIYQEQSTGLASRIQTQYRENIKRSDRGVKQAGFWVLFMTTMPSVLTETGFITNPAEEKFLNSKPGQEYIASAIFRAFRDYITEIDSKSIILAPNGKYKTQNQSTSSQSGVRDSDSITFRVQVATSVTRIQLKPENFKGISDISEVSSSDRFRYITGSFSDYYSAVKYRKKMEDIFPDAFVVAIQNNKILPLQKALELIKNQNNNK